MQRAKKATNRATTDLLAYIHEGEVVSTTTVIARAAPDWTADAVKAALARLASLGVLHRHPMQLSEETGQRVRMFSRTPASDEAETSPELRRYSDAVPFVRLFTPPLPAFRIRSTRVLRPLSSPVEDAA